MSTLLSLALLTVGANANIFPTEPVAASTWSGGEKVKLLWKDDNVPPLISELNNLTIELMTGTDTNQTSLSVIGTNIKGIAGTADYTVPKDLGPPGKF
ncbi:13245_t:CDS:2 [Entrophospora sp. SA101]|nr:13245_t:CDS:2 [Entrophospora sp. SA101]